MSLFFCQKIYFHHTGNLQNVILFEGVKTLFAGKIFIVFTTRKPNVGPPWQTHEISSFSYYFRVM